MHIQAVYLYYKLDTLKATHDALKAKTHTATASSFHAPDATACVVSAQFFT
jgi:hypothetical protein